MLTRDDESQVIMKKTRERHQEESEEEGKQYQVGQKDLDRLVGTCLAEAEKEPLKDTKTKAETRDEVKEEEATEEG